MFRQQTSNLIKQAYFSTTGPEALRGGCPYEDPAPGFTSSQASRHLRDAADRRHEKGPK